MVLIVIGLFSSEPVNIVRFVPIHKQYQHIMNTICIPLHLLCIYYLHLGRYMNINYIAVKKTDFGNWCLSILLYRYCLY